MRDSIIIDSHEITIAAINTLGANKVSNFMASVFGKKINGTGPGHNVTISVWRGKKYLIKWEKKANHEPSQQGGES